MRLTRTEMENLIDKSMDNQEKQVEINRLNAESINELITRNRFLHNKIDYLQTKVDRYKRAYLTIYNENKEREKATAAYSQKINEEETEH